MAGSLVYYDYVINIYVGINATAQEVFSTCIRLFGVCRISVGINATTQEVFSITRIREYILLLNVIVRCCDGPKPLNVT